MRPLTSNDPFFDMLWNETHSDEDDDAIQIEDDDDCDFDDMDDDLSE